MGPSASGSAASSRRFLRSDQQAEQERMSAREAWQRVSYKVLTMIMIVCFSIYAEVPLGVSIMIVEALTMGVAFLSQSLAQGTTLEAAHQNFHITILV